MVVTSLSSDGRVQLLVLFLQLRQSVPLDLELLTLVLDGLSGLLELLDLLSVELAHDLVVLLNLHDDFVERGHLLLKLCLELLHAVLKVLGQLSHPRRVLVSELGLQSKQWFKVNFLKCVLR